MEWVGVQMNTLPADTRNFLGKIVQFYNPVRVGEIVGRGTMGVVYSTENPRKVVKVVSPERFPNEYQTYKTAAKIGVGARIYGWTLVHDSPAIIMERFPTMFDYTDGSDENCSALCNLIVKVCYSGWFCADFHGKNIMWDVRGNLRLIDPTLMKTVEFVSKYLPDPITAMSKAKLRSIGMGLMIDYITHPLFGGVRLDRNPNFAKHFVELLDGCFVMNSHCGVWELGTYVPRGGK